MSFYSLVFFLDFFFALPVLFSLLGLLETLVCLNLFLLSWVFNFSVDFKNSLLSVLTDSFFGTFLIWDVISDKGAFLPVKLFIRFSFYSFSFYTTSPYFAFGGRILSLCYLSKLYYMCLYISSILISKFHFIYTLYYLNFLW